MNEIVLLKLCKEDNGGWFFDKPISKLNKESYGYFVNIVDAENVYVICDSGFVHKKIGCSLNWVKKEFGAFENKDYKGTLIFSEKLNAIAWLNYVEKELIKLGYTVSEKIIE